MRLHPILYNTLYVFHYKSCILYHSSWSPKILCKVLPVWCLLLVLWARCCKDLMWIHQLEGRFEESVPGTDHHELPVNLIYCSQKIHLFIQRSNRAIMPVYMEQERVRLCTNFEYNNANHRMVCATQAPGNGICCSC